MSIVTIKSRGILKFLVKSTSRFPRINAGGEVLFHFHYSITGWETIIPQWDV